MDYTVHVVLIVATFMVDTSQASRLPLSHTYTGHNSCRLPVTRGWGCIGRSQRWGYDNRQGTCVPFTYTGCNGNRNNFKTEDDCRRSCMQEVGKVPVITPVLEQSVRDPCELPHDNGGCYNSTTMWYYDVDSMTCFPFTYHGCGGNENRFSTRAICMGVCGPRTLEHQNELARDVMDFDELEGFEDLNAMPVCYLGISKGSCHSSHPRFFSENGVCKQFDYSGCKGNANNFATISDCEESCGTSTSSSTQTTTTTTTTTTQDTPSTTTREVPRDCAVAPEYGSCDRSVMMYYYNSDSHSCGRFIWSGCGGNQNRFTTLRHCQSYCIDGITELPTTTTTEPTTRDPEVCNMPITTGPCRAYLPRFGYNSQSGNCEGFVFGGCRGNDNNFDTMEQCQAHCETRRTSTETVSPTETPTMPPTTTRVRREICTLPRVIGPCRMSIDRYWFNLSTEQCEYFVYGGCQGNANSFDTQAECEAVCVRETPTQDNGRNEQSTPADVCLQPRVIGHCRMAIRSYWFNHETQQCERFIYGGCGGNGNRFESRQECESTCQDVPSTDGSGRAHQSSTVPPTPDTCSLPRVVGRCRAAIEMYWYNQQTNHCERFMYGGCEGNANRFDTVEECESACRTEEQTTAPVTAEHPTSAPVPVCMQPRAAGPCEAAIRAYWYNHETNQCERFTYGGCEGNDNRFSTRQECESTCRTTAGEPTERANPEIPVVSDDVCTQQRVVGPCRMAVDAYWYNHETLQCEHFVYGGCQGNGNRFNTLDECQSVCHTEERNVPIAAPGGDDSGDEDEGSGEEDELINEEQGSEEDACAIEPQGVGLCRMMILWFSYDPAENKCNEIHLGGCRAVGGFESMDECLNSCVTSRGPEGADEIASGNEDERRDDGDEGAETREEGRATYTVHEVCTLPSHSGGNCGRGTDDTQTRYHFVFNEADPEASRCEPFQYTGCGGNRNNFREEELCMEVCAGSWNE